MSERILILASPTPGDTEFYRRWEVCGEVNKCEFETATILVVDQHVKPFAPEYALPALKCVVSATTGHTHLKWAEERGLKVLTLRGETELLKSIRSVSEFTVKALLEISRPKTDVGHLLNGKSLGIVGMGRIGKHVTVLANAFGMRVYSVDKGSPEWAWKQTMGCDFVSIHASEEPGNAGLVSRELLERMPTHAWLINTARGSLVDEQALYELLAAKRIAGAYLDVTERQWQGVNVITTGHIAGFTLEDRVRTDDFMVEKLKRQIGYKRSVRQVSS